jgi:HAD superfamily hydrolase (TIGR01509 family)
MVQGVLFDWRGTLVYDPPDEWWLSRAMERAGRTADAVDVARLAGALRNAAVLPEVVDGERTCDCSVTGHREWSMTWFARAGLDADLAEALYALDFEAESHPFFPDVEPVLRELHARRIRVAVVSDIHVDLRPEFVAAELDSYVDAYVFSFEHGVQKPGREIYDVALRAIGVDACDALMVGDRASHDGVAVKYGITTLLLPPPASATAPVGLAKVLALVNSPTRQDP